MAPFILDEKSSLYIWSTESSQEQRESRGHGIESQGLAKYLFYQYDCQINYKERFVQINVA